MQRDSVRRDVLRLLGCCITFWLRCRGISSLERAGEEESESKQTNKQNRSYLEALLRRS